MSPYYTGLEDARVEIRKRWHDQALKQRVEEYLDNDIPPIFRDEPRAVLFRNIASPDFEFMHFLSLSKKVGLKPVVLEYLNDRFSTRNADKLGLVKLALFERENSKGEPIIQYRKLVDIKANDNKRFIDIKTQTREGRKLVDVHHDLIERLAPGQVDIVDISEWISRHGGSAADYYKQFLPLFLAHGILFEDFVVQKSEAEFEKKAVIPALEHTVDAFSAPPLVCSLVPDPTNVYWWSYPADISNLLD
jgi:hypothetical protein